MRKNFNTVHRAEVEAASKIRFGAKIQEAKREREGAQERANVEADMK